MGQSEERSGFDKLARPYRWMEYLTFGPLLMRCRLHYLPVLGEAEHTLVLGDGDGRFCAALLLRNRHVHVDAVDSSAEMLELLRHRAALCGADERLETHLQDARGQLPAGPFDLVCSHFFLDCLTEPEVAILAERVRQRMPHGWWVVSEFAIPSGAAKWSAFALIWLLYAAFGVLAGLKVKRLPDHGKILRAHGFTCLSVQTRLFGLLRAELWHPSACAPVNWKG